MVGQYLGEQLQLWAELLHAGGPPPPRKIYVFGPKFSVFWPKSVAQIIPISAQISYFFGPNYCLFGPNNFVRKRVLAKPLKLLFYFQL